MRPIVMRPITRRTAWAALAGLAACAAEPPQPSAPREPGQPRPWRTLQGGFAAPARPALPGLPPARPLPPAIGPFVRWTAPAALALAGFEMLVADLGSARLWRVELAGATIEPVAGAPVAPGVALALGPDLSAWVLDAPARQVLRFARDGRLLQTYRAGAAWPAPSAMALADGGATLLLADPGRAAWAEQRGPQGLVRSVATDTGSAPRTGGVAALAGGRSAVFVLDRLLGAVHRVARDGRVEATLGLGDLRQPLALALDRSERAWVLDAQDGALVALQPGRPPRRWPAETLGLLRPVALAADGLRLALADGATGSVHLFDLDEDTTP